MDYHTLAYFYHWSNDDLKHLPRTRREMYVDKVRQQIAAENGEKKNPLNGEQATSPLKNNGKEYRESNY